eukprot:TRINITY_DN1586_c0_g1_i2.p1 TRINITY_DN1586_c0_g1~~TRINITY_DN1586_c0_g1_i2.p1  ORF type:complete len:197 (+),score=20.98 TRINITY_DN1586_c0_g1_i2:188-778(+)
MVDTLQCQPLTYTSKVDLSGTEVNFKIKIAALSSHHNGELFKVRVEISYLNSRLYAFTKPIRTVSKPKSQDMLQKDLENNNNKNKHETPLSLARKVEQLSRENNSFIEGFQTEHSCTQNSALLLHLNKFDLSHILALETQFFNERKLELAIQQLCVLYRILKTRGYGREYFSQSIGKVLLANPLLCQTLYRSFGDL